MFTNALSNFARQPEIYSMEKDINEWLTSFVGYKSLSRGRTFQENCAILSSFLDDQTFGIFEATELCTDWDEFIEFMRRIFAKPKVINHVYLHKFAGKRQ